MAFLVPDETETARRNVREAIDSWSQRGFHLQHYYALFAECQIDLYEGKREDAYERIQAKWGRLVRSMILRIQVLRIQAVHLRARVALAAARTRPAHSTRLLREAEQGAAELRGENMPWANPLADAIQAGIFYCRGQTANAIAELEKASRGFSSVEMALYSTVCCRHRGALAGADRGQQLIADADAWMDGETIRKLIRWAAMLVPGFEE